METSSQRVTESIAAPGRDRAIGAILIDAGRLSAEGAEKILREQKAHGLRFGDAAIALGLLKQADIDFALNRQFEYPVLHAGDESVSEELIAAFKPSSAIVEQLRALRSQLMVRGIGDALTRSLAVVSAEKGEGRSFIAANLAVVFSQLGERTLLIDADLRRPRQHELFKLDPRSSGLSSLLSGRAGSEAIVRIPSLVGLSVLPAGAVPPNPQELLARAQFSRLLDEAGKSFDVIIIDTPSAASSADSSIVAARSGAALLLARQDFTPAPALLALKGSLAASSVKLVGAVLNNF
ncbi:chain length determinant protein tyrosine kinase EpsG [Niveibacterium terrae]|uniref:chain length determinant protein tyrosine kinase EpsG n=1 Tax=Niveibacterium terrae TaxID=3373598 RepID=UPI003A92AD04